MKWKQLDKKSFKVYKQFACIKVKKEGETNREMKYVHFLQNIVKNIMIVMTMILGPVSAAPCLMSHASSCEGWWG